MSDRSPITPLVSVVVPTYNRATLLEQAIDSVVRQTYEQWELLIIDDGSTDNTTEVVAKYEKDTRIKYFSQGNRGQAAARNVGIKNARGDFVAFLDSDNRWLPQKLSDQVHYLYENQQVDVLYGDNELIDLNGTVIDRPRGVEKHSGLVWRQLLIDNFVPFNTSIVKRKAIREIGGFDESVRHGDDYDLWLRLSRDHVFEYLPGIVTQYRIDGVRISDNLKRRYDSNRGAVERFLAANNTLLSRGEQRVVLGQLHARFGRAYSGQGDSLRAYLAALTAITHAPLSRKVWRKVLAIAIEPLRRVVRAQR